MNPKFKYNREDARSALALGKLERAAMNALWDKGEMSGSELFKKLGAKLKIRHNTLLTVLERLVAKGLVSKYKDGRNNFYKPVLNRDEYCAKVTSPILNELLGISAKSVLSTFIESASEDTDKIKELKRLIEEIEKKLKSQK
jgi:BlaI family penicillinase repressor